MPNTPTSSDDLEFTVFPDLQMLTDKELEELYFRGDNLQTHDSKASRAKRLLDIRRARVANVPKDPVKQQITIGNLYGQFAAVNNGTMVQNNNQDVMEALNALTNIIADSKLDEDKIQDALGDIQTLQAQATKKNPDRKIAEIAFNSLQVVTNLAIIASIGVIPYMDKIQAFIQGLPVPGIK
jgi:hypothetical protein